MRVPLQCCPHNAEKGNEHEQVRKSIACYMALSIPPGMGAEVPLPDVARSDREGGTKVRDDVFPAAWVPDRGNERAG